VVTMDLATEARRDCYEILGVARTATEQEIKAAFQNLASAFHAAGKPKNIDDVEEIRKYARAYRVLSDAKKREYYDRTGFAPLETAAAGGMEPVAGMTGTGSVTEIFGDVASILSLAGVVVDVLGG